MMNERKEWYCIGVKDHSWWSNNAEWDINPFSGFWECKRHDEKGAKTWIWKQCRRWRWGELLSSKFDYFTNIFYFRLNCQSYNLWWKNLKPEDLSFMFPSPLLC